MFVLGSMIPDEAQRVERVIASARAFLAIASLAAIYLDPTEPSRFEAVAYALMVLYVLFAVFVLLLLRLRPAAVRFRMVFHSVDIIWPALISVFTAGPGSPFFLFYTFVLLAAAYRWGLRETLATAGVTIVLFVSQGFLGTASSRFAFLLGAGGFDQNRFVMRSIDLLIFGYLLGYLGEEEKRLRQEGWIITRLIGRVQAAPGLAAALGAVLRDLFGTFDADRCMLALANERTEETFLWQARREPSGGEPAVSMRELSPQERPSYLFKLPWAAWYGVLIGPAVNLHALDHQGRWSRELWTPPVGWVEEQRFEAVLAAAVNYGKEWSGNFFLFGGRRRLSHSSAARLLQALIVQISPALYGAYVTQRLRSRAGAAERARVARELHDGIIQSLIGIEMQVDVLRRQPPAETGRMAVELARLQELLRQEVLSVRELMEQMRPADLGPRQLVDYLADTVDKFGRDSGIGVNFSSAVDDVSLPPRICHEVARIAQEGLANVRRHSGARHVVVSFAQQDGRWKLVIDDDGRGFDFSGRLTQAELDSLRKGPVIIKERTRAIGGDLVVDSQTGRGARLEVTIPRESHG